MKLIERILEELKLIPFLLTSAVILLLWNLEILLDSAGESLEGWLFRMKAKS